MKIFLSIPINIFAFLIIDLVHLIFCANHNGNPNPNRLTIEEAELSLSALLPQANQLKNLIEEELKVSQLLHFSGAYFTTLFELKIKLNDIKER
ncbi:hypothetical protein EHP00_1460 [Ecytonucleospora hepatopenaei]|uniref:Uncharacterized protein n=1 Tax=Ecytonucleospora hepatopenaei TaxID=646526 RepID=A0A1W0E4Q2_9MICR|nr:hypothetical protein EHP00_1460 [Ecytonucleospora hepatopenaei]